MAIKVLWIMAEAPTPDTGFPEWDISWHWSWTTKPRNMGRTWCQSCLMHKEGGMALSEGTRGKIPVQKGGKGWRLPLGPSSIIHTFLLLAFFLLELFFT